MNGESLFGRLRSHPLLTLAIAGTLLLLVAHVASYWFLTDDAFISFRYAHNLSRGDGLVFNPGGERVEGYTNFLWVLILAALDAVGLAPERAANPLGLLATVALWASLLWYILAFDPPLRRKWLVIVPLALFGMTRSIAVWSSSGLETRLFGFLIVAGILRLLLEVRESLADPPSRRWPVSAALLALATLTRPSGLLISACVFSAAALARLGRRRLSLPREALWGLVYSLPVAAHLLFRWLYYGALLPNTFYAKVDPGGWWKMGWVYLFVFVLEYAAYLWLPWLAAAVFHHRKQGTSYVPLIVGAAILPHALFIIRIGGDHFEFRPFDFYFPLLLLMIFDGLKVLPARRGASFVALAAVVLMAGGIVELPYQSHRQAPDRYISGFPGADWALAAGGADYMNPRRDPVYRWPLLRNVGAAYASGLRVLSRHLVGIRQEEHAAFCKVVTPCGRKLGQLIADGVLPADIYIAMDSVGAIPYFSGARTLDRLGLTDARVAREGPKKDGSRAMAHDRYASLRYAFERGVDIWSVDNVRPIIRFDDPVFAPVMERAFRSRIPVYWADVGEGYFLVAIFPQGAQAAQRRMPRLRFYTARDRGALERALLAYRSPAAAEASPG